VEQVILGDARGLLGGDLEIRLPRLLSESGHSVLKSLRNRNIALTHVSELVAMASTEGNSEAKNPQPGSTQLVELKVVEEGYPLYGRVEVQPPKAQDADLEYDPKDYFRLLEPIQKGAADVVYGSRFLGKNQRVLGRWGYTGNKIFTSLFNWATHQKLTDVWTGYKVFKREVLQSMTLLENGFGFEPEVTAKVGKGGWRICEVPISYSRRTRSEGKKITWKDGIRALYCILRYK